MKIFITILSLFFALSLHAEENTISESYYNFVKINFSNGDPHFLEIGSESCPSCKVMGKLLYKIKQKYPQYNIDYINVNKDRSVAPQLGVQMIPTQIIYNGHGEEVYRHIGKLSENELLDVLKKHKF